MGSLGSCLASLSMRPHRVAMSVLARRPWGWRHWSGPGPPICSPVVLSVPFRNQHSRPTRHAQSLCSNCCQTPRRSPCASLHCAHPENTALPSSPPGLTFRGTQGEQITVPQPRRGHTPFALGSLLKKPKVATQTCGYNSKWTPAFP